MMGEQEFAELKKDIKKNGLKVWGATYRGQVLDGRNRYKACQELGIEMQFRYIVDHEDFDPFAYVLSHNVYRRHLDESQRAMVAAKLATMKHGGDRKSDQEPNLSLEKASSMLSVSKGSTKNAKKVIAEGSEKLQQAVEQGSLPVSVASELVKAVPDKDQQTEIVSKGADAVRQAVKETPLAQKRLTKQQAAEKRKQANAPVEATATASPGLAQLRKAWAKASQEEREAFINEVRP
jgi:ParB-like chromosome segregation protein Spo0J